MSKKHRSILSISSVVVLTLLTSSGCALLGLEEEEETTTEAAGSLSDLEGTWATNCTSNNGGNYYQVSHTFAATSWTLLTVLYDDDACSDPLYKLETKVINLSIGSQTTLTDGSSGYNLTGIYDSNFLSVLSDTFVTSYNSGSACGKTDWEKNVAVDVTGVAGCTSSTPSQKGDVVTEKYKISGAYLTFDASEPITLTKQ